MGGCPCEKESEDVRVRYACSTCSRSGTLRERAADKRRSARHS